MIEDIIITELVAHPLNRHFPTSGEKWEQFCESIASHGVLVPPMVRPHPTIDGGYQILAGHRRVAACVGLGHTSIACEVRNYDDAAALEMMVIDNLQREDLDPIEESRAVRALVSEAKLAPIDIAKKIGRSLAWVTNRQMLLDLPEDAVAAIRKPADEPGHLYLKTAELIMSLPPAKWDEATQLVLHPDFESEALRPAAAAKILDSHIGEPLRLAKIWAGIEKAGVKKNCEKQLIELGFKNFAVRLMAVEDINKAGFLPHRVVVTDEVPPLQLRAGAEHPHPLLWLHLVERHGLPVWIVPDYLDTEQQWQVKMVADLALLRAAEESRREHDGSHWLLPHTKPDQAVYKDDEDRKKRIADAEAELDGKTPEVEEDEEPESEPVIEDKVVAGSHYAWVDLSWLGTLKSTLHYIAKTRFGWDKKMNLTSFLINGNADYDVMDAALIDLQTSVSELPYPANSILNQFESLVDFALLVDFVEELRNTSKHANKGGRNG